MNGATDFTEPEFAAWRALASGVYLLRARRNDPIQVRRMMVMQ